MVTQCYLIPHLSELNLPLEDGCDPMVQPQTPNGSNIVIRHIFILKITCTLLFRSPFTTIHDNFCNDFRAPVTREKLHKVVFSYFISCLHALFWKVTFFLNFYFEKKKKIISSSTSSSYGCHNGCLGHTALFCCCPFHSETKMSSEMWNKCETHKWDATPKYSLMYLYFVHVNSNVWSSVASQKAFNDVFKTILLQTYHQLPSARFYNACSKFLLSTFLALWKCWETYISQITK